MPKVDANGIAIAATPECVEVVHMYDVDRQSREVEVATESTPTLIYIWDVLQFEADSELTRGLLLSTGPDVAFVNSVQADIRTIIVELADRQRSTHMQFAAS